MLALRHRAAAVLIPLALLAACTAEETGTPVRATPTTASHTPSFGAPSVPDPLDATAFATDPCASLTDAQRDELGVDHAAERTVANGAKCDYSGGMFASVLYSNKESGLAYLYGLNEADVLAHWEPTEVDGYPAVAYAARSRPEVCEVAVGLSDSMYVSVGRFDESGDDRCAMSKRLAGVVLSTIRAGQ